MRLPLIAALLLLTGGCETTYDLVTVGPNTYQVSARAASARGGIADAQHRATEAANEKCKALGKITTVTRRETVHEYPPADLAIVRFTCT
jgi:hypothetical protein